MLRPLYRRLVPLQMRKSFYRWRHRKPVRAEPLPKPALAGVDIKKAKTEPAPKKIEKKVAKPDTQSLDYVLRQPSLEPLDLVAFRKRANDHQLALACVEHQNGNLARALRASATIEGNAELSEAVLAKAAKHLRDLGRHDLSIRGDKARIRNLPPERADALLGNALYHQQAFEFYRRFVEEHEPEDPKGYVIIFDLGSRVTTGLMVPLSLELLRTGYDVCAAVASTMPISKRPELQGISGAFRAEGLALTSEPASATGLRNEWHIDWESGQVSCDGINYFTYFLERISKLGGVYKGGLSDERAKLLFHKMLRQSDLTITLCKRTIDLARTGKPVRFVSMDTHFAPWGVLRRWCDDIGKHHSIHLIGMSVAYENYFSNLSSLEAKTVSVEDLTAQPDLRHPFLGGRRRFNKFLEANPGAVNNVDEVMADVRIDRSRTSEADAQSRDAVTERIAQARSDDKRVICAFGKVLIDFAAPDDRGNVFRDFPTWLMGLLDLATKTGALLLIKPHPHEIRPEIVQGGVQMLRELLPPVLPDNVIFLDHNSFNSAEIADLVDAMVVWNGTACTEGPILGTPVFAESIWAARDYPIDSPVLRSSEDYARLFDGRLKVDVSEENRKKAIAHVQFMRSSDVSIPFQYVRRAGTNQAIGANLIYADQMLQLEEEGDPNVTLAAGRFFEYAG